MKRVILSTKLIIGEGDFNASVITIDEARQWLAAGPFENFCGHETVRILALEPVKFEKNQPRPECHYYDEALCLNAKARLDFGREYSLAEIEKIGVEITLIRRIPTISQILALAAQLPSGLNDAQSLDKLNREFVELEQALAEGDLVGAYTEAADTGAYYLAKHLDRVSTLVGLTPEKVLRAGIAKYQLRAQPGNPKNDEAERQAVSAAVC